MSTATTNKKTASQKLADARKKMEKKIADAKTVMEETVKKAKKEFNSTKEKLKKAKEIGYNSGVRDAERLPEGRGVILTAQKNYGTALRDVNKAKKLTTKINKGNQNGKKS